MRRVSSIDITRPSMFEVRGEAVMFEEMMMNDELPGAQTTKVILAEGSAKGS